MKWLQWSQYDLAQGLGGVEVHARCLARELQKLGVEAVLSKDPQDLEKNTWDVVQTHGSSILPFWAVRKFKSERFPKKTILVHTLHGTTLGRMAACGEWTWPGGYLAAARERIAVQNAQVVLAVHEDLFLYRTAQRLHKTSAVCSNGWDAGEVSQALPSELLSKLQGGSFWLYIGRGSDPVKGADRLILASKLLPDVRFLVVPGEGFEAAQSMISTGRLSSGQILTLFEHAQGLVLCSRYEGLPLVVLEALAQGLPVVATRVGGLKSLATQCPAGLVIADSGDPRSLADALRAAQRLSQDQRVTRCEQNRQLLWSWKKVAQTAQAAVAKALQN